MGTAAKTRFLVFFLVIGFKLIVPRSIFAEITDLQILGCSKKTAGLKKNVHDPYFEAHRETFLNLLKEKAKPQKSKEETLDRIRTSAIIAAYFTKTTDSHYKSLYLTMLSVSGDQAARDRDPVHHQAAVDALYDALIYKIVTWRATDREPKHPLRLAFGDHFNERVSVLLKYLSFRQPASLNDTDNGLQ